MIKKVLDHYKLDPIFDSDYLKHLKRVKDGNILICS